MILLINDPAYLAQINEEITDHVVKQMGSKLWQQTMLLTQLPQFQDVASMGDIDTLMQNMFQTLPFYLTSPYLKANQSPIFTQWTPTTLIPPPMLIFQGEKAKVMEETPYLNPSDRATRKWSPFYVHSRIQIMNSSYWKRPFTKTSTNPSAQLL